MTVLLIGTVPTVDDKHVTSTSVASLVLLSIQYGTHDFIPVYSSSSCTFLPRLVYMHMQTQTPPLNANILRSHKLKTTS